MRVCVCVHIYKYIFFHQTVLQIPPDIIVKQKSQYPMFLNSFLQPVSKCIQKANKKKPSFLNFTQKQTKPDKPHKQLRSRPLLLLWTKGYFHVLKLPYGTKDTKTSPVPSIWITSFFISTKYQNPSPPHAGAGQFHDSRRLSLPPPIVGEECKAPEKTMNV